MSAQEQMSWLVKSSGRILGPYSADEIGHLLKSRELSPLDEVSSPLRRWDSIQFHPDFKEIVESLRKATLSEKTEATWTPTGSMNLTQTMTDLADAELTESIDTNLSGFTATAKEIVIHDMPDPSQIRPPSSGRFQTSFGHEAAVQKQVEKTTKGLWLVTILVLVAVAAFVIHQRWQQTGTVSKPSAQSMRQQVVDAIQVGHYAEALRTLKNFFPDPMRSGDMAIYFGSLLIQVEGQSTLGRRLLNLVLSQNRPETKQALTGLGIADLIDGQQGAAIESFEKALKLDGIYVPALVNLSWAHLQRGDYLRAKQSAERALQISPMQAEALLVLSENALYIFKSKQDRSDLLKTLQSVQNYMRSGWDYNNELGFYVLYLNYLLRLGDAEENVRLFLDRDPQLTEDHRHNVFIYRDRNQWRGIARLCEQMAKAMGDGARVVNLLAVCHLREGHVDLARRDIERAVQQSPKDPLIQSWYSYILREASDAEQASVLLGRANEANRRGEFILPVILQARFCQQNGDLSCARDSWQRIYERNLDYLPAVAGMAEVLFRQHNSSETVKLIERGLKISPDYIPLLVLRQNAEREGWYGTGG